MSAGRFGMSDATRSPRRRPMPARCRATRVLACSSSSQVRRSSCDASATASGARASPWLRRPGGSAGTSSGGPAMGMGFVLHVMTCRPHAVAPPIIARLARLRGRLRPYAGTGSDSSTGASVDSNCSWYSRAYAPPRARSAVCVPRSTTRPRSYTRIEVGAQDRREAMGDRQCRAAAHRGLDRALDEPLADGVERARGLVEDEDARVLQQDARQRDALLLATRELVAAFADHRVIAAAGQLADAVMHRRQARGGLELSVGGVGLGIGQVLADRGVEQIGLLGHEPDDGAEARQVDLADVDAVDSTAPRPRRRGAARGTSSSSCPTPTARRARRAARARSRSRCPRVRRAGRRPCRPTHPRERRCPPVGRPRPAPPGRRDPAPLPYRSRARRPPSRGACSHGDSGMRHGGSAGGRARPRA